MSTVDVVLKRIKQLRIEGKYSLEEETWAEETWGQGVCFS